MKHTRPGFTLMEILIVMFIIVALFAMLLPGLFNRQKQAQINEAQIKINQLGGYLEQYNIQNRGYPTTEQGLMALIYFPDNAGISAQPGLNPAGSMGGMSDLSGGMSGNASAVGPDMLAQQGAGNTGMTATPQMQQTMGTDPSALMSANSMSGGVAGAGTWNQPTYNPQIYTQQRKRPAPYLDSEQDAVDPWGTPYRYENTLAFNGVNRTGSGKPAIWSAGPDKQDGTDDDVRNWDPAEAQTAIAQRQNMGMNQQGMGGMSDPMGMGNPLGGQQMGTPMQPGNNQMGGMNPAGGQLPTGMQNMPAQPGGNPAGTPLQPGSSPQPAGPPM
ncbi:hypothetical protein FACS189419_00050 [Planctomycetales bacterium]|nr:hypothetical protein FACS189419_00050 [Planctomycetales bacterium]